MLNPELGHCYSVTCDICAPPRPHKGLMFVSLQMPNNAVALQRCQTMLWGYKYALYSSLQGYLKDIHDQRLVGDKRTYNVMRLMHDVLKMRQRALASSFCEGEIVKINPGQKIYRSVVV